ncbi:acyl-CoA dehydrogenase family protein [Mycolicibacterium pyrenivorans]|uniref:acyl-CoA dehydrogenase family protein n=1 Tax=Mycolicibacterium pyrenivorans TaxID=187102 RepID=UPI00355763C9
MDGRGGHEQRRLHHRGGPADVSAARRGDGSHHRVRQTVSSIAKAYVSEAVNRVAGQALQLPGGIGFTWEHDLHLLPTAGPRQRPALR